MRFSSISFIRPAPVALENPTIEASATNKGDNLLADIPHELLLHLLSFLPAVDLANAAIVFETSKVLPSISKDRGLWSRHTRPAIPELAPPPTQASWQRQWRACPRPLQLSILKDSLNVNVASRHEIASWRLGASNHDMAVTYVYQSSRGDNRHNAAEQFAYAVQFATRYDTQPPSHYFARYAKALLDKGITFILSGADDKVHRTLDEVETYLGTYKVPLPTNAVDDFMRACRANTRHQQQGERAASRLAAMTRPAP